MPAVNVIADALEPFLKDAKLAIKLSNEVFTALDNGGWLTTDDDHLALLRSMRRRIAEAVNNPDCPARDLASLSRRLQDVSREVTTLEEKERQEGKKKGGGTSGQSDSSGATGSSTPLDPAQI